MVLYGWGSEVLWYGIGGCEMVRLIPTRVCEKRNMGVRWILYAGKSVDDGGNERGRDRAVVQIRYTATMSQMEVPHREVHRH